LSGKVSSIAEQVRARRVKEESDAAASTGEGGDGHGGDGDDGGVLSFAARTESLTVLSRADTTAR
jgi:hypothetical protein